MFSFFGKKQETQAIKAMPAPVVSKPIPRPEPKLVPAQEIHHSKWQDSPAPEEPVTKQSPSLAELRKEPSRHFRICLSCRKLVKFSKNICLNCGKELKGYMGD